jgi:hypothetical protein
VTMAKRNAFVVLASPVCHMALTANLLVGKTFLVAQMCKTDTWTVQSVWLICYLFARIGAV